MLIGLPFQYAGGAIKTSEARTLNPVFNAKNTHRGMGTSIFVLESPREITDSPCTREPNGLPSNHVVTPQATPANPHDPHPHSLKAPQLRAPAPCRRTALTRRRRGLGGRRFGRAGRRRWWRRFRTGCDRCRGGGRAAVGGCRGRSACLPGPSRGVWGTTPKNCRPSRVKQATGGGHG